MDATHYGYQSLTEMKLGVEGPRRNETRGLSLMSALRVNSGTGEQRSRRKNARQEASIALQEDFSGTIE
jgi:hypothetical protein